MAVKFTEEQLNNVDKSFLISLLLQQQEQMESLTKELHDTNEKMQKLMRNNVQIGYGDDMIISVKPVINGSSKSWGFAKLD